MFQFNRGEFEATVRDVNAPPVSPWAYPTEMAIGPKGQIVVRHLTPNSGGSIGDVPLRVEDGEFYLSPRYRKAGWVLYRELCNGDVPGVPADHDAWKRWQSLIEYNATGRRLPKAMRNDDKLLHPEVARRRQRGGFTRLPSIEEFKAEFPGADFDDEDDEPAPRRRKKGEG